MSTQRASLVCGLGLLASCATLRGAGPGSGASESSSYPQARDALEAFIRDEGGGDSAASLLWVEEVVIAQDAMGPKLLVLAQSPDVQVTDYGSGDDLDTRMQELCSPQGPVVSLRKARCEVSWRESDDPD